MMFAGIYGILYPPQYTGYPDYCGANARITDINFAVFNRFSLPGGTEGYFFALFSIAISAAETAVAIAIMINIYRNIRSIQVRKP